MAADLQEKASAVDAAETTSSSAMESPTLEPIRTTRTNRTRGRGRSRSRSRHSTRTQAPDDFDVYRDLEHALSADVETEAERQAREPITYTRSGASMGSVASRPPEHEVYFAADDPDNPHNWSLWYRSWTLFVVSFATWLVVLYSTSYTATTTGLMEEFDASETVTTLGVTSYLLGLAAGSLVLAPMSELYGRQVVYVVCMSVWAVLIIPCALAQSLTGIILIRFFGALFGAVMISNGPGTVVDICHPDYLSLGMSVYSVAPFNGPVLGPLIGGFIFQYKGWRWTNWIVLILAGVCLALILTMKETYPPAILKRKAARLRKENDDPRWWCQYDQKVSSLHLIKVNLSRPCILFATEPILWFLNLWLSLIYGILYLCFIAYPVVFSQYRGWGPGTSGLAFLGIGIGIISSIAVEPLLRRFINSQPRDPRTGRVLPEAAALVMGFGTVLSSIGQLGFAWTCLPVSIPWVAPMAFGIPFGAGNTLAFIYGSNYLAGAYGIYAASALAGCALLRSIFGATLPLAGTKMFQTLSPQWAGTLLGLLEVAMIPIPFVFWRYGGKIRNNSKVIRQLREEEDAMEEKKLKNQQRRDRNAMRATREARLGEDEEREGSLPQDANGEKTETATTVKSE